MADNGPSCCRPGCPNETGIHLYIGGVEGSVSVDATYSGASYCSWEHLRVDIRRLQANFDLSQVGTPTDG